MKGDAGRFSPGWWALWTWDLIRPGLFDDEEPPEGHKQSGAWDHYPDGFVVESRPVWDRRPDQRDVSPYDPSARRPAWPAILRGQTSGAPSPRDMCRLHNGACSGLCERFDPG